MAPKKKQQQSSWFGTTTTKKKEVKKKVSKTKVTKKKETKKKEVKKKDSKKKAGSSFSIFQMFRKAEEPKLTCCGKFKLFMAGHWGGVLIILLPIIIYGGLRPGRPYSWCAFTLLTMGIFWVTEVIPLPVTGFMPVLIFPLTHVYDTVRVCMAYINDSVMMFVGSLMLAASIEQSGYHKRLAFCFIRVIGYSHLKLLLAMCTVTTFASMWITNTAAMSMMVPILFALLKVFENEGIITIYNKTSDGNKVASDITSAYFCAVAFSATNGGIGTLVGTGTNLVFKAQYMTEHPEAPEYLSFPKFCMFAVPYMILLELFTYLYMAFMYFGFLRSKSPVAVKTKITPRAQLAAKDTIKNETKKLGRISFWEGMVIFLFGTSMIGFFCRSPQMFPGWGDVLISLYNVKDSKFVKDSALAMLFVFLMLLLPSSLAFFKNCTAKYREQLPKSPIVSVLHWPKLNAGMPYSFMFLLGGGVALSKGAKESGLNEKLGEYMKSLSSLPNAVVLLLIIIVVVFFTNFCSNVAVSNVFVPIAMALARNIKVNSMWYCITAGFSASFCYMIAVGTPPNLIAKTVANIPPGKLMKAGLGPTITTILITFAAMLVWAPIVWPNLHKQDYVY